MKEEVGEEGMGGGIVVGDEVVAGKSSTAPTLKGRKLLEHMVATANNFVTKVRILLPPSPVKRPSLKVIFALAATSRS